MAKSDRKTLYLKRTLSEGSCVPLCDFVINYTAISPVSRRSADGSMIFTGGERDVDGSDPKDPKPESVAFEGLTETSAEDVRFLAKGGRVLAPLKDPLLRDLISSCDAKVFTFDLDDPDANFFAQNIKPGPSGYSFELVYRPASDTGSRMISRFIPGYDKNLFAGVTIGSTDIEDVLRSVIAFGCASLMGIEPSHVRDALVRYVFPSRPKEVRQEVTKEDILGMRDFEED